MFQLISFAGAIFYCSNREVSFIMIRRVALLFAITGLGHVLTIFGLRYLASTGLLSHVAQIGEIDTLIQTLIYIIGFGIQTEAIRTTAFAAEWKSKLDEMQVARTTMSLVILPAALFMALDWTYASFLVAPVLGLSADYALYSRGKPLTGAIVAFFRVVTPLLSSIIVAGAGSPYVPEAYLVATAATFLVTNLFISSTLGVPAWWRPTLSSLRLFVKTLPVGIINLCFFFFGLGILTFAKFLVSADILAIAFMGLKFYMIYKGAIRVVHQGFISKLKDDMVCRQVDHIAMMMALVVFGSVAIYPETFIGLLFGPQLVTERPAFFLIGVSVMVFSLFASVNSRALIDNRDREFLLIAVSSVVVSLIVLAAGSLVQDNACHVILSLLAGEVVFAGWAAWRFLRKSEILNRMMFLVKNATTLLVPYAVHYVFAESLITYGIAFLLMALLLLLINHRALKLGPAYE